MLVERAVRIPIDNGIVVDGDLAIPLVRADSRCSRTAAAAAAGAPATGRSRRPARPRVGHPAHGPAHSRRGGGRRPRPGAPVRHRPARRPPRGSCGVAGRPARGPRPGDRVLRCSTGAAAALVATARHPSRVGAVVSRGGRPDLAGAHLYRVQAPTLLIVGGHDQAVIHLNRDAARRLRSAWRLEIVPGATHLFEEPGRARGGDPPRRRLAARPFRRPHQPLESSG